jgi:hypothetical protein
VVDPEPRKEKTHEINHRFYKRIDGVSSLFHLYKPYRRSNLYWRCHLEVGADVRFGEDLEVGQQSIL